MPTLAPKTIVLRASQDAAAKPEFRAYVANPLVLRLELPAGVTLNGSFQVRAELHSQRQIMGQTPLAAVPVDFPTGNAISLEFTAAQMNQSLGGMKEAPFWLLLRGLLPGEKPLVLDLAVLHLVSHPASDITPEPPAVDLYAPMSLVDASISASMAATEASGQAVAAVTLAPQTIAANGTDATALAQSYTLGPDLEIRGGTIVTTGDEEWRRQDIYLSARNDSKPGRGTYLDPYNASTPDRIDAILGPLSVARTPVNLNWGVGEFIIHTKQAGSKAMSPWYFRSDWRWIGKGKGRTIFKVSAPPPVSSGGLTGAKCLLSWERGAGDEFFVRRGQIRECSFDGGIMDVSGWTGLRYLNAVDIEGGELILSEVDFQNFGGVGQEIFPLILTNGRLNESPRDCRIIMAGVSGRGFRQVSGPSAGGIGFLITGISPQLGAGASSHQRSIIRDLDLKDAYITAANFQGFDILDSTIDAGLSRFAAINIDTGINRDFRIKGCKLRGTHYQYGQIGVITIGNGHTGEFTDFEISETRFEMVVNGFAHAAVLLNGGVDRWNIHDNDCVPTGATAWHGMMRLDDTIYVPGSGLNVNSVKPAPGAVRAGLSWENVNGSGTCLNNKRTDTGAVPRGMENTLKALSVTGALTASAGVAAGATLSCPGFLAQTTSLRTGPATTASELNPYSVATFSGEHITEVCGGVLQKTSGFAAWRLRRTGGAPSSWGTRLVPGSTVFDIFTDTGVANSTVRFFDSGNMTGLVSGATLTYGNLTAIGAISAGTSVTAVTSVSAGTFLSCPGFVASATAVRTGPATTASELNPYSVATFSGSDVTGISGGFLIKSSGWIDFILRRTSGSFPASFGLYLGNGSTTGYLKLGDVATVALTPAGSLTGQVADSVLTYPRIAASQGFAARSSAEWPTDASLIPAGHSVPWIKTAIPAGSRIITNIGGVLHYGPVSTTTP